MPQRWVLACVAEIPEVVTNSILIQVHVPVLVDACVARGRLQFACRLAFAACALGLAGGLGILVAVAGGPSVRKNCCRRGRLRRQSHWSTSPRRPLPWWPPQGFNDPRNSRYDWHKNGARPENAFAESFNGRLRDECLNIDWFMSLSNAVLSNLVSLILSHNST